MLGRIIPTCLALFLGVTSLYASEPVSARLQVDKPTSIPGSTLSPGTYSIHVVDHLSDRYILRVDGGSASNRPTFLGIPSKSLKGSGEIKWANSPNDNVYLKGWNFGGSTGALEFAYPKDDAVALAKANRTQVAAIDPGSEGRVSTVNGLSKEDMQLVTLWLLSPTHVGAGAAAGIKAQRYSEVASAAQQKPAVLPHTGSSLPLVALLGCLSLLAALGLRGNALVRN